MRTLLAALFWWTIFGLARAQFPPIAVESGWLRLSLWFLELVAAGALGWYFAGVVTAFLRRQPR